MHFQIADSDGSVLDTFDNGQEAVSALRAMVADDPSAASDLLILSFTANGEPSGPARTLSDLLSVLPWFQAEFPWTQERSSTSANPAVSAPLPLRSGAFRARGSKSKPSQAPAVV